MLTEIELFFHVLMHGTESSISVSKTKRIEPVELDFSLVWMLQRVSRYSG